MSALSSQALGGAAAARSLPTLPSSDVDSAAAAVASRCPEDAFPTSSVAPASAPPKWELPGADGEARRRADAPPSGLEVDGRLSNTSVVPLNGAALLGRAAPPTPPSAGRSSTRDASPQQRPPAPPGLKVTFQEPSATLDVAPVAAPASAGAAAMPQPAGAVSAAGAASFPRPAQRSSSGFSLVASEASESATQAAATLIPAALLAPATPLRPSRGEGPQTLDRHAAGIAAAAEDALREGLRMRGEVVLLRAQRDQLQAQVGQLLADMAVKGASLGELVAANMALRRDAAALSRLAALEQELTAAHATHASEMAAVHERAREAVLATEAQAAAALAALKERTAGAERRAAVSEAKLAAAVAGFPTEAALTHTIEQLAERLRASTADLAASQQEAASREAEAERLAVEVSTHTQPHMHRWAGSLPRRCGTLSCPDTQGDAATGACINAGPAGHVPALHRCASLRL